MHSFACATPSLLVDYAIPPPFCYARLPPRRSCCGMPLFSYGGFWVSLFVSVECAPANCLFAGFALAEICVSRETMSEFIAFGRCIGGLKLIFLTPLPFCVFSKWADARHLLDGARKEKEQPNIGCSFAKWQLQRAIFIKNQPLVEKHVENSLNFV